MRAALILGTLAAVVVAGPALAGEPQQTTTLTIEAGDAARHGEAHEIRIVLTDARGTPLAGETVALFEDLRFFDYLDTAFIAEVRTDSRGAATLIHIPSAPGPGRVTAQYAGSDTHGPAGATVPFTVTEGTALVTPVIPTPSAPLLPRGVTAAWFVPLLIGVWLALGAAVYHLVRIPLEGPARREQV